VFLGDSGCREDTIHLPLLECLPADGHVASGSSNFAGSNCFGLRESGGRGSVARGEMSMISQTASVSESGDLVGDSRRSSPAFNAYRRTAST